ncbi:MAG TPA: TonB-dependent receptor plug domain-containing protein, partial [Planctomycetota bacterium]|nr:TonB-dependent receptor plug domain-containing protein [Planctomycetota bacterium]
MIVDVANQNGPVDGARVEVLDVEREIATTTAADGTFELRGVPAGGRRIRVVKDGLLPVEAAVDIRIDDSVEVRLGLIPEQPGNTLIITGKLKPTGATAVAKTIRERTGFTSAVGRRDLGQQARGDLAAVAQQLPAVSTVDSKFVYVRGLGDRYSQTLLNGSFLPSPEPDRRAVPLDLFPTNLLDSISIAKTYSPDIPGEFAGGSVQIQTVDVPDKAFLTIGTDLKYRNGTTLRDFRTYHGGNLDFFSVSDGRRRLPDEVPRDRVREGTVGQGLTDEEIQEIGRSFTNIWNPATVTAPVDHKVSISFGQKFGGDTPGSGTLGIIGAVNWANKYQTTTNEKRRVVVNGGTVPAPIPLKFSDFRLDTSTFQADLSGLLNITYRMNDGQKIGVRSLYTRTAEDEVREQEGIDGQRQDPVQITRLRYIERSLLTVQPFGEHLLAGDTFLEWRGSYALSQRDEPDNRQVRYLFDPALKDFAFEPLFGSGRRDFYLLDENIYDFELDYSIPFNPFGVEEKEKSADSLIPDQKIKLGPSIVHRDRDFNTRRFLYISAGGVGARDENGRPIDFFDDAESLFQSKNINPDGFIIDEVTRATDNYGAKQTILAAYGLV